MSLANAAAGGAAKLFGAQAIRASLQVVGVVVLSRLISPTDFGLFAMVAAVANLATVIGDFGLSAASIQSVNISAQQKANLFWTNVALGVALAIGVVLLAYPLAAFYGHPEVVAITQVMSLPFLANALAAQFRAELSRNLRFAALAIVDTVAPLIALTGAIYAGVAGWGYWALVVQPAILAGMTLLLVVPMSGWWPGIYRRVPMKDLYKFGAGTLGIQISTYISTNIDDVLVGRYWGSLQAGYYSRSYQLFRLPMQQIAVPVARVALPILSRIQQDSGMFERFVLRGQLMLAYVFGGLAYMLAGLSDPVIELALGPGWDSAKPIFFVLAVGGVFQSITTGYWWMFQAKGLVMFALRFSLAGRAGMIGLLFLGLSWGPVGVACASAMGQALMWGLYTAFAVPRAGVSRRALISQAATPVLWGCIAMLATLWATIWSSALGALVQLGVGVVTFMAVVGVGTVLVPRLRDDLGTVWATGRRGLRRGRA